jgi:hypothetical protein
MQSSHLHHLGHRRVLPILDSQPMVRAASFTGGQHRIFPRSNRLTKMPSASAKGFVQSRQLYVGSWGEHAVVHQSL